MRRAIPQGITLTTMGTRPIHSRLTPSMFHHRRSCERSFAKWLASPKWVLRARVDPLALIARPTVDAARHDAASRVSAGRSVATAVVRLDFGTSQRYNAGYIIVYCGKTASRRRILASGVR